MKTVRNLVAIVVALMFLLSSALAIEITPYADSEFNRATASLSTRKDVSFSCITFQEKKSISVTKCWLQKKVNGKWEKVCDLTAPEVVFENTMVYGAVMDYSSSIGTGTYRVGFTADADGHTITRYSNERSF